MSLSPGGFAKDDDPEPEDFAAPNETIRRKPAHSNSILAAALSGMMIALGWEQDRDQPTIVMAAGNDGDDWLHLDFGVLDPLDHRDDLAQG